MLQQPLGGACLAAGGERAHLAPLLGDVAAVERRLPVAALARIGGDRPLQQLAAFRGASLAQADEPEPAQRIGVGRVLLQRVLELRRRLVELPAVEVGEAGDPELADHIGRAHRRRRRRGLQFLLDLVVAGVLLQVGLQRPGAARLVRQPEQRLVQGALRRRRGRRVAGERLQPLDALRPRLLSIGQRLRVGELRLQVLRVGDHRAGEAFLRRRPAALGAGKRLVVFDREIGGRRGAVEHALIGGDRLGGVALPRQLAGLGELVLVHRPHAHGLIDGGEVGIVRRDLLQPRRRTLRRAGVAALGLDLRQQGERARVAGGELEGAVQCRDGPVGLELPLPELRLVDQHPHRLVLAAGRRGRVCARCGRRRDGRGRGG